VIIFIHPFHKDGQKALTLCYNIEILKFKFGEKIIHSKKLARNKVQKQMSKFDFGCKHHDLKCFGNGILFYILLVQKKMKKKVNSIYF
jgi:hypothetical protein